MSAAALFARAALVLGQQGGRDLSYYAVGSDLPLTVSGVHVSAPETLLPASLVGTTAILTVPRATMARIDAGGRFVDETAGQTYEVIAALSDETQTRWKAHCREVTETERNGVAYLRNAVR